MPKLRDRYGWEHEPYRSFRDSARGVTAALGAQNKWLDTIQEWFFIENGMMHVSRVIHNIAHKALAVLDEFSDILHERHLETEYPETKELGEKPRDVSDALETVCTILDQTEAALTAFRNASASVPGISLKTENLIMEVSAEQKVVLALWKMWDNGISASSFDNWAKFYTEGGAD